MEELLMNLHLLRPITLPHALINESAGRIHPLDTLHDLEDGVIVMKVHDKLMLVLLSHHK
jgi:hypothetical protein